MADFRARIMAELDSSRIQDDLNDISGNYTLTLRNINIDQAGINDSIRQIQRSLDQHRFRVNFDVGNLNISNIQRQIQNTTGGIQNNIQNITGNIRTEVNAAVYEIDAMRDLLRDMRFDDDSIDHFTRHLEEMDIAISNISTRMNDDNIRLSIRGVDDLGRIVRVTEELDLYTGDIRDIGRTISESFDTGAAAARQLNQEFRNLYAVAKEISKIQIDIAKLNPEMDSAEIMALTDRLNRMTASYEELRQNLSGNLPTAQMSRLSQIVFDTADEINRIDIRRANESFNELVRTAKEISKIEIDLSKLDANVNVREIEALSDQLLILRERYDSLAHFLSEGQVEELGRISTDTESAIRRIQAKREDETNKLVDMSKVEDLDSKMSLWLESNSKAVKEYGASIEYLQNRLADMRKAGRATKVELEDVNREFKDITVSARLAGKTGASLADSWQRVFKRLSEYVTADRVIDVAIETTQAMYENVTKINSAMIELKKVTDETNISYNKFLSNAGTKSKEIGTTISEYISSTADFARLGYNFEESQHLAEVANVYNVVGDDINNIDQATESIISTMVAFNMEVEDSIDIVNKYNEVANKFSISSGGIGDALRRSASSLASGNNSLDESIGLITAANTVVQDADVVGTALKTISMRIRSAKTELQEAGLDTEGMAESTAKLRREILALSGVDIMLNDEEFKSTYQIMDELSNKWKELTDIQQASVIELIAGTRQGNIVSSLMENFDTARKVVETSLSSDGSAYAELDRYMEGIEAKTKVLASSFENLSRVVLDEGWLGKFLDAGSGILNLLTGLIDKFGLLGVTLISVPIVSFVKNIKKLSDIGIVTETLKTLGNGSENIDAVRNAVHSLSTENAASVIIHSKLFNELKEEMLAQLGLSEAKAKDLVRTQRLNQENQKTLTFAGGFKQAIKGVGSVIKAHPILTILSVVGAIIGGIKAGVDAYEHQMDKLIESASKINTAYSEANSTFDSNIERLESLKGRFDELSENVDENGKNINLTAEEYKEYLSLVGDIVDISPDVCKGYDNEGNAIVDYKKVLDQAIESQEKFLAGEKEIYIGSGEDIFKGAKAKYRDINKELSDIGENLSYEIQGYFGNADKSDAFFKALDYSNIEWVRGYDTFKDSHDIILEVYENHDKVLESLRASGKFTKEELADVEQAILKAATPFKDLNTQINSVADNLSAWASTQNWYQTIPIDALDEFAEGIRGIIDLNGSYETNRNNVLSYGEAYATASQKVSELAKQIKAAADEYNRLINGNVDYNRRPMINGDRMRQFYPEFDGDVATTYSQYHTIGEGEFLYTIDITPILEDGTILNQESLDEYIKKLVTGNGIEGLLESDKENLIINVVPGDYDKAYWDEYQKNLQAAKDEHTELYSQMDDLTAGDEYLESYANSLLAVAGSAKTAEEEFVSISDTLQDYRKVLSLLKQASDEYNRTGSVTFDTYNAVSKVGEEYAELFTITDGKVKLTTDSLSDFVDKLVQSTSTTLISNGATEEQIYLVSSLAEGFKDLTEESDAAIENIKELVGYLNDAGDGKQYSSTEIWDLIHAYPELAKYIVETADGYRIEEEGILAVIAARKQLTDLDVNTETKEKAGNTLDKNAKTDQTRQMVDDVFARYEKETGEQIETFEQFEEVWAKYNNNLSKPINGWVTGLKEYVNATIDQNEMIAFSNKLLEEDFSDPAKNKNGATETEFERQYKEHQHYLELGQESEEEYLAWLTSAYETAFNDRQIKEDDYLKYKEEAYNLNKTLFQNSLTKTEERISALSETEDNVDEIVSLYEEAQESILHEMEGARRSGESENSEYLQTLRNQWLEYEKAVVQLQKDTATTAIDRIGGLVDILNEQSEGVEYSGEQIMDLIAEYPELLENVEETAKGYVVQTEAVHDLIKELKQLALMNRYVSQTTIDAKDAMVNIDHNAKTAEKIDAIFEEYYLANDKWISSVEEFNGAWGEYSGTPASGYWAENTLKYIESKINDGDTLERTAALIDSYTNKDNDYKPGVNPSDSKKDEETEFERQYKEHNHLLNMDKESVEDYLAWLRVAYKASFDAGEMELDDFYKYKEEVYEKEKELFEDSLTDTEHQISLLENATADNNDKIVELYEDMQRRVHAKAEEYRAAGLDDNHEILQELQNQWWSYEQAIEKIREEEFDTDIDEINFDIETLKLNDADSEEILSSYQNICRRITSEIEYYTSKGYSATSEKIRELTGDLRDAKEEILDYLDEIVEKANEVVDGVQDAYTTLTDAAKEYASTGALSVDSLQSIFELGPKYLTFLYNENGQLVINKEAIQKVIAARTEELAAETALAYAKQVLQAVQEDDINSLIKLTDVTAAGTNATWDMAYATLGLARAIGEIKGMDTGYFDEAADNLAKMQSMTKTAVSTISTYYATLEDGYVSQEEGLNTILELTQDMIKWENERLIDALEKEKEDYADIIDQKKELIQLAKEQANRESSIAEKLEKAAKLQEQIAQLSLDDSREARAKRSSLEEELAKLQKELSDEQADHSFEVQEEALDKELEAFEETKDDEIEALEDMLSSTEKLYRAALERINSDWQGLYSDLYSYNENYGNMISEDLVAAWDAASAAVQKYGSYVEAVEGVKNNTNLGEHTESSGGSKNESYVSGSSSADSIIYRMRKNSLDWFTADNRSAVEKDQQALADEWYNTFGEKLTSKNGSWYRPGESDPLYTLTDDEVGTAVVSKMEANASAWHMADKSRQSELAAENEELARLLENFLGIKIEKTKSGVWMLGNRELFDVYHTGGVVGGTKSLKEREVLAKLEEGELVLTEKMRETLIRMFDEPIQIENGTPYRNMDVIKRFASEKQAMNLMQYETGARRILEIAGSAASGKTEQKIEIGDIYAPVNVVQELTEDEIKKHAKQIGSISAEYIEEGFRMRGMGRKPGLF